MKIPVCLIVQALLLFSSYATEKTISLEEKVNNSDAIILGEIVSIELGEVGIYTNIPSIIQKPLERQIATITIKAQDTLFGELKPLTKFTTYSLRLHKTDGCELRTTVGFNLKCQIGEEYLVYLKEINGSYSLAFDSNQYFMRANTEKGLVQILGHDYGECVPLRERLEEIRKLTQLNKSQVN